MDELISEARKRSEDPAQEQLRQHKDDWNKSVSYLISRLIAFKRGVNGRGDPKQGIPPSSIKDPLPQEVVDEVSNIDNSADSIISGANYIIDEQKQYSEGRRKGQVTTASLEVDASIRRFLPLFQFFDETRAVRREMLVAIHNLEKYLDLTEDELLSSSENSIVRAFDHFTDFLDIYRLDLADSYIDFKKVKKEKKEDSEKKEPEKAPTKDQSAVQNEEPAIKELADEDSIPDVLKEYKRIHEDIINFYSPTLAHVISNLNGDNKDIVVEGLKKSGFAVRQTFMRASKLLERGNKIKSGQEDEFANCVSDLADSYNTLLSNIKANLPQEVAGCDTLKAIVDILGINVTASTEINKLAANIATRWLKQKMLGLTMFSDKTRRSRLESSDMCGQIKERLKKIEEVLSKRGVSPTLVDGLLTNLQTDILELAQNVRLLAETQRNKYMRQRYHSSKKKNLSVVEIKENVLRSYDNKIKAIQKIKFEND